MQNIPSDADDRVVELANVFVLLSAQSHQPITEVSDEKNFTAMGECKVRITSFRGGFEVNRTDSPGLVRHQFLISDRTDEARLRDLKVYLGLQGAIASPVFHGS